MSSDYIIKVLIIVIVANLIPTVLGILMVRLLPSGFSVVLIPSVVVISSRLRDYFAYGRDITKPANYISLFVIIVFIYFALKYKFFEPKNKEEEEPK